MSARRIGLLGRIKRRMGVRSPSAPPRLWSEPIQGTAPPTSSLEWAKPFSRRCKAVRERRAVTSTYWGRCDLRPGHKGDHALDRAMDIPMWSTEWTA